MWLSRKTIAIVIALMFLSLTTTSFHTARPSSLQPLQAPPSPTTPNVGIWNDACFSFNMTVANPQCAIGGASLAVGSTVTVDVNVTNAPIFNGYEFSLFYDQKNLTLSKVILGSPTVFDQPFAATNDTSPGIIRESVVTLGAPFNGAVGVLAYFQFTIKGIGASPFVLAAGTSNPAEGNGAKQTDWTRLTYGANFIDVSTSDGYFQNIQDTPKNKLGPVAKFTFSPANPQRGQTVSFDASNSFDPDNQNLAAISRYVWDFGDDVVVPTQYPKINHSYGIEATAYTGNFSILLRVIDADNNFTGMASKLLTITPPPFHDVAVSSVTVTPASVQAGVKLNVSVVVQITPKGTFDEKFNLSITWGPPSHPLINYTNQVLSHVFGHNSVLFKTNLDTTGFSPGTYEVDALAIDPLDNDTSNNSAKSTFTIQPTQTSPLPYIIGGGVAVVAAIAVVWYILQRRRRLRHKDDDSL